MSKKKGDVKKKVGEKKAKKTRKIDTSAGGKDTESKRPKKNNKKQGGKSNGQSEEEGKKREIRVEDLFDAVYSGLKVDASDEMKENRDNTIRRYLIQSIEKHDVARKYNVLILYDRGTMVKSDADYIYNAVTRFTEKRSILLVLYSNGGSIDSAYLIGKLCKEYAQGEFIVVVPRQAKSAATLLSCAADQIHMGSLSELGPIDPQMENLPALGLKNSVEHLADLVRKYPAASEMFAKYLNMSLKPIHLGYYERVAESATQYAERLLKGKAGKLRYSPEKIAYDLVYTYKDHAFVIDKAEAEGIFGDKIIRTDTPEYELGERVYATMGLLYQISDFSEHHFYFIGSPETKGQFTKKRSFTPKL